MSLQEAISSIIDSIFEVIQEESKSSESLPKKYYLNLLKGYADQLKIAISASKTQSSIVLPSQQDETAQFLATLEKKRIRETHGRRVEAEENLYPQQLECRNGPADQCVWPGPPENAPINETRVLVMDCVYVLRKDNNIRYLDYSEKETVNLHNKEKS